jgi:hypothetical protein
MEQYVYLIMFKRHRRSNACGFFMTINTAGLPCGVFYLIKLKEEIAMIMAGITLLTWLLTEKDST